MEMGSTTNTGDNLNCGWQGCDFLFTEGNDFYNHVTCHLPDLNVVVDSNNEESYECAWKDCGYQTKDSKEITRHVKCHGYHVILKNKAVKASRDKNLPACSNWENDRHLVIKTTEPYICYWEDCNDELIGIVEFIDHIKMHVHILSPNNEKKHECKWKDCHVAIAKKSKLNEHVKTHSGERTMACPNCGHLFANLTKFTDHCFRQQEATMQCSYCNSYLPNERLLREHRRQHIHHYRCSFCDMSCNTPAKLKNHIKYRHLNVRKFKCTSCNYKCKSQNDLQHHMTIHSTVTEKLLNCVEENCKFSSNSQNIMTQHCYKEHSDNPIGGRYCCHVCDKTYTYGKGLTRHLNAVHNIRKPSGFSKFIYKMDSDGYNRLQTFRLESVEMDQMDKGQIQDEEDEDDPDEVDEPVASNITIEVFNENGEYLMTYKDDLNVNQLPPDAKVVAIGE